MGKSQKKIEEKIEEDFYSLKPSEKLQANS
jgi:hypothetical protein